MSWITLTDAHVKDRLSTDELDAVESTGETATTDRLAGIITQVTHLVRGKVSACDENLTKMGAAGTIPDELLWAAATIARSSLTASIPISEGETDPRSEELREAHKQLEAVARCKLTIVGVTGSLPSNSAGQYGGDKTLDF